MARKKRTKKAAAAVKGSYHLPLHMYKPTHFMFQTADGLWRIAHIMCTYGERQTLRALRLHMHEPTHHVVFSRLVRAPVPTLFVDGRSLLKRS